MLRTTWHSEISTQLPPGVPPTAVISILHDHGTLISLQPIVTRYAEASREGERINYDVWEAVDLLPGGIAKKEIQFTCAFEDAEDGVTSWIKAPMGLVSKARYSVMREARPVEGKGWKELAEVKSEGGEGGGDAAAEEGKREGNEDAEMVWWLVEKIESECNVLMKAFVEGTMSSARRKMHAAIMVKAKGE